MAVSKEQVERYIRKRIERYETKLRAGQLTPAEERELKELYAHRILIQTHWPEIAPRYARAIEREEYRNELRLLQEKMKKYNTLILRDQELLEALKKKEPSEKIKRAIEKTEKEIKESEQKLREYQKKKEIIEKELKGQTS